MNATEMKQNGERLLRQSAAIFGALAIFTALTSPLTHAAEKETTPELAAVLTKIDRTLLEQNEQDIGAWLDARIAATGDFGVYSFGYTSVQVKEDTAKVDLNRGALADSAAQFLRAYEMLGERNYLDAALKTADFFLQVQQPEFANRH